MKIPLAAPDMTALERSLLLKAFDSNWLTSSGEFVKKVEQEQLGQITGKKYNLLCSNGTVALHLALLGAGIGPGDEVIVPSLTYVASANAVLYAGATPVFIDVDEQTWTVTESEISKALSARTKAIMGVHLYGHAFEARRLMEFAQFHSIKLIEDVSEGLGGRSWGELNGSVGHVSTYSFYGNKLITSGEGGAVATDDPEVAKCMKLLRDQGMDPERRYYFPILGYNYRITNLQAAILSGQLERLEGIVSLRREQTAHYQKLLGNCKNFNVQQVAHWCDWSPWLFSITAKSPRLRETVMHQLAIRGIETRPFFIPIHSLPPYGKYAPRNQLVVTNELSSRGFNLPLGPHLNSNDIEVICEVILGLDEDSN